MSPVEGHFTAAELQLIREALLDARVVLEAADGGVLHQPRESGVLRLNLSQEICRVEAALMLVTSI